MWVKICGITNLEDAVLSLECGADAIGLIFAKSPRRIDPAKAKELVREVKGKIKIVGVFSDMNVENVKEILELCMLDLLQFHGDESPQYCKMFNGRVIKAVRFNCEEDLRKLEDYDVEMALVDSAKSGNVCNWNVLKEHPFHGKKLILAGGLNPENITNAIMEIKPFGVDSGSGVEGYVGKKDPKKVNEFINRAKAAGELIKSQKH